MCRSCMNRNSTGLPHLAQTVMQGSLLWNASASPSSRLCAGHFGVEFEQFFEALGVVFEAAADVDAFEDLVVAIMRVAEVFGHLLRIVALGDGLGEMRLAGEEDVLCAAGQVAFVQIGRASCSERCGRCG